MNHRGDSSAAGASRTAVREPVVARASGQASGRAGSQVSAPASGRSLRAALLALTLMLGLPTALLAAQPGIQDRAWTATWGTAPAGVAPDQVETLDGQTLRLIVRVSSGGAQVRVRLSN